MNAKNWLALGLGVSAAALIALLYAPQSGEETRKRIGKGIDDGVGYLGGAADYLREQANTLGRQAQAKLEETRGQVSGVLKSSADGLEDGRKNLQQVM